MTLEKWRDFFSFIQKNEAGDSTSPVETELLKCQRWLDKSPQDDDLIYRFHTYLDAVNGWGLEDQTVVDSCWDLALTLDPYYVAEEKRKIDFWEKNRKPTLRIIRPPRAIPMQLYPSYFKAILEGRKPFEGRAYDPSSEKRYESIRSGDKIIFSISQEIPGWEKECQALDLNPNRVMKLTVVDVHFAPRVHWMYQFCGLVGAEFQPMVKDPSEIINIQRVAAYFQFPGYKEKISDYGFVGIEVMNPEIIQ